MSHPIALCARHVAELANSETFQTRKQQVIESARKRQLREFREEQEAEVRARRRAYETEVRRPVVDLAPQVYYIAIRGAIKIGFTTNMRTRMIDLLPDAVLATEPGDRELEAQRHRQFAHLRAPFGREYFSVHPDLLEHIESVLLEHGPPKKTGYSDYKQWHQGEPMLVTVKEAARIFQLKERTLYDWINAGRLTVKLPPGKTRPVRVSVTEVEQLVVVQVSREGGRLPKIPRLDKTG